MIDHPEQTANGRVTHFVLTRFNVRMPIYLHPDDSWLPDRMRLFEQYCLPSFAGQSNKRFTWLIFADGDSPTWLKEQLEEHVLGLGEIVYVPGFFTGETAADTVRARTRTPYVITTRVDNDDAIANDFIDTIQSHFANQDLQFVNLVNGAQYSQGRLYVRPYTRNPFISLVEATTSAGLRTVFVRRHFELDKEGPIANVKTPHPMWLQVVHGDNALTELVGLRTRPSKVVPYFSCHLDVDTSPVSYMTERASGSLRIAWRLAKKPKRVLDLVQTMLAPKSP